MDIATAERPGSSAPPGGAAPPPPERAPFPEGAPPLERAPFPEGAPPLERAPFPEGAPPLERAPFPEGAPALERAPFPEGAPAPGGPSPRPALGRFRDRIRRQLRDDVLDAAYDVTVASGWNSVRMTMLADRVGVSRQTLYKEFGSKEEVGRALVLREACRLIEGVTDQIRHHDKVPDAIHAALSYALERSAASPLLRAVLTSGSGGMGGDSLLPIITEQSRSLISSATALLSEYLRARTPGLRGEDAETIAGALVRLTASNLMLPLEPPARAAARLTRLAVSALKGL